MRDSTRHEKVEEIRGFKYIRLKAKGRTPGRLVSYWEMRNAAERADSDLMRAVSRCLKLVNNDYELERLADYVSRIHEWIHAVEAEIERRQGVKFQEERIAALRITTGRSAEEAEMFKAKADELERKLRAS